jgi:hypothetical protein
MLNGSKNRTPLTSPTLQIGTSNPLGWVLKLDPSCFDSSSPVLGLRLASQILLGGSKDRPPFFFFFFLLLDLIQIGTSKSSPGWV